MTSILLVLHFVSESVCLPPASNEFTHTIVFQPELQSHGETQHHSSLRKPGPSFNGTQVHGKTTFEG